MTEKPKLKEWQDQLLTELGTYLPTYGFDPKIIGQEFHRKTAYGWDCLHLNFGKYTYYLSAAANLSIRIDRLEDLINENDPTMVNLSKKEKRGTASFGGEIGNLSLGKRIEWKINSPEEIPGVAAAIIEKFEEVGIPYFEKYSDLEMMYQTLIRQDREGWKHSPIIDVQCKSAVGLAYLLGKVDEIDELIERCEQYQIERYDFGLESFRQFAKAIKEKMMNSSLI